MSLTVQDLLSTTTADQAKAKLYALADAFGLSTTAWQKLSPLRTVFAIVAQVFSGYTTVQATLNGGAFLETSSGDQLTICARQKYGVVRNPASFAPGVVVVDNTGGGLYSFGPGDLIFLNSTTGKTYFNKNSVVINPLQTGVNIDVLATEVGSASTASPGQIDSFSSALPLLNVTNPAAVVGDDEETDDELRIRCTAALGALSPNGAPDAYRYVATTQSLNGGIDVTRVKVLPPPGDGTVTVVIAGPSGALSGGDVSTVDTALQKTVVREVDTEYTESATNVVVNHSLDVYISTKAGLLDADVVTLVQNAVTAYYPVIPISGIPLQGGPAHGVSWRAIEAIARNANPFIFQAKLASETDTILGDTDVAIPGTISVTVHQVSA